ncbi:MAG: flagellar biosynthesis protein FlhB [Phycisphaerae bacterium]|nr:flagellar biosynthesis protein FlhB [Phycisphaerae bacterium]
MAEKPASERTEDATPERLKKAREEGQIPESREVPSVLMIAMLLLALTLGGSSVLHWLSVRARRGLSLEGAGGGGSVRFGGILSDIGGSLLVTMLPFILAGAVTSVLASFISSGWSFAPKGVQLRMDRINPANGLKQIFSSKGLVRMLVAIAKMTLVLLIVWLYLRGKVAACLSLRWASPAGMVTGIGELVVGVTGRIVLGLAVIAGLDLLFQRWRYKRDLRMSRREIKEERKQHELSPELKGRIRGTQMDMARKRMLNDIPQADVVITNPTHVAVALKYDAERMASPQVIAKGPDLLCERIKAIAREHAVPVVHRPELARALYGTVDVGEAIPEALFVAVAEVLAMIYRLRRNRNAYLPTGATPTT